MILTPVCANTTSTSQSASDQHECEQHQVIDCVMNRSQPKTEQFPI